ncbi:hypothetical protein [Sphingobacterium sp. T2]|uniref:hypothetical protein n=1 Tax=Sphingobacterium sp. T2 TaxID=1590596 RepID=UPI001E40F333|nr:hypothetical protein [Sphingobacterium sp. T2]
MKKLKYILALMTVSILMMGCERSIDPGDWNILPEREIEDPQTPGDEEEGITFKVMSMNMALGTNAANFQPMLEYIKEYDPDLLLLRQVDSATTRANKIDRPQVVADSMGMYVFFKKNFDYQTGGFGNAVLSKFPIKETYARY